MNLKIVLLDRELVTPVTEENYEIVRLKLNQEKQRVVDILKNCQKKGLIKSIKRPVDITLLDTGNTPQRVRWTDTPLQKKLDNLIKIRRELTKAIETINNSF